MANIEGGVKITGFISPTDTLDQYAVIDPIYGIDGLRNVTGSTELNNIPAARRRQGMIVGVHTGDTVQYYSLLKNSGWAFDDTDWIPIISTGTTSPITLELTNSLFATAINAGSGATSAIYSNFIGYETGIDAVNAQYSNFLGNQAGSGATDAEYSNFLGNQAGYNATNAVSSNFLGDSAGNLATNASNSNFLGRNAGSGATNASQSNFFGNNAGQGANNASFSNFLGLQAGRRATGANNSNFLGRAAGEGGVSANFSNFIGYFAGSQAANANNSNFLGESAGEMAINANNSNFFGYYAGYQASGASLSNFFGAGAGSLATNAQNSNFFGVAAGAQATNAQFSNFLGRNAGTLATGASYSTFIGYQAGYGLFNNIGSNNIIIGTNIALSDGTSNSLNIGGVLFGTNLYSDVILKGIQSTNGRIGINVVPSSITNTLHVSASTNPVRIEGMSSVTSNNFILTSDANGVLSTLGGNVADRIPFLIRLVQLQQVNFLKLLV